MTPKLWDITNLFRSVAAEARRRNSIYRNSPPPHVDGYFLSPAGDEPITEPPRLAPSTSACPPVTIENHECHRQC